MDGESRITIKRWQGIALVAILVVVAFALGRMFAGGPAGETVVVESAPQAEMWTCSMHPQIQLPGPGKCPICHMDLIPVETDASEALGPRELRMSESARQLARIQTAVARRGFASRTVRLYGKVAYDESRVAFIAARVPGRLDRLYADYTGMRVRAGDHLVEIYSPELLAAQEELIQANRAEKKLAGSSSEALRQTATSTLEAAREKLRLYGLTTEQIAQLEKSERTSDQLTVYAPIGGVVVHKEAREGMYVQTGTPIYTIADLSKLWVLFEAYEQDLPWIHYGQRIRFTVASYPGEPFQGLISFIDPLVDPKTRTVRVRAVVENQSDRLKPDMFVTGTLESRMDAEGHIIDVTLADKWICPMHPEVVRGRTGACPECGMDLVHSSDLGFVPPVRDAPDAPILIPQSAPLITGTRAVVYVEVDRDDGTVFEGREVQLGPRAGDFYVVRSGIEEGERVVTNGAFKIDSELQIQARPSMMSPEGARKAPSNTDALTPVYAAYFDVQMALANDDLAEAKRAAPALTSAARAAEMKHPPGDAASRWMSSVRAVISSSQAIEGADTIASARESFFTLSNAVIALEKQFGHAGDTHFLSHCPMARGGEGASWLQNVDVIWNPYYGDEMLRCGSIEAEWAAGPVEESRLRDN